MRLKLQRITDDLLVMEAAYSGGGGLPPEHFHPRQDEHFEVLEGSVRAVINGEEPPPAGVVTKPAVFSRFVSTPVSGGRVPRPPGAAGGALLRVFVLAPGGGFLGRGGLRCAVEQERVVRRDELVGSHHRVRVVDAPVVTGERDPARALA